MKKRKLYDIYIENIENNIQFSPLDAIYTYADENEIELPEWFTIDFKNSTDYEYIFSRSGDKYISNYVSKLYDFYKKLYPTDTDAETIGKLLENIGGSMYNKFMQNWVKLYDAMFADYNPIQNYDSTEEITRSGDDKVSVNTDTKQTQKVSAFNTSALVDNSEVDASGLASNNYSKTDYNSKVKTTRYGNIGVTTSQQMIESEITLRKTKFIDLMFDDIDTLFVSNLYFIKD